MTSLMQSVFEIFFIQVPPPFEELAVIEAKEKYHQLFNKELDTQISAGGFEVSLPYQEAVLLNHYLKIPNRILLVIKKFKCRDFPKLYKQISKIRWKDYFADTIPTFKITTKESRMLNSSKIEKTLVDAFKRSHIMYPVSKKDSTFVQGWKNFNLFVQVKNDECSISVDTSGERLSLRQERTFVGEAPIRENLAAALFYQLTKDLNGQYNFIDPMCGSGVFLIEAHNFYKPTQRNYSFNFFAKSKFDYQTSELKSKISLSLFGNDLSLDQIELCQKNLKLNNINATLTNFDLLKLNQELVGNNIVITNPPYGKRLEIEKAQKSNFESNIIKKIHQQYKPKCFGIISPNKSKKSNIKFKNGGIKLNYILFKQEV